MSETALCWSPLTTFYRDTLSCPSQALSFPLSPSLPFLLFPSLSPLPPPPALAVPHLFLVPSPFQVPECWHDVGLAQRCWSSVGMMWVWRNGAGGV